MRLAEKLLVSFTLAISLASPALGATIAGSVKGPDGAPFMGAFVVAENTQNRMTVSVLSDQQGRYQIANLPAATYAVRIRAIGYRSDPRRDVQLSGDQKASLDFALQKGTVRWSDLTTYQGRQLLPKTEKVDLAKGGQYPSDPLFQSCFRSCHSFQTRMASAVREEDGWRDRVKYMRDVIMGEGEGGGLSDPRFEEIVSYLTHTFGPDSTKPASPADIPAYKETVRPLSPRAMNIAYVEYDVSGSKGLYWSAVEDKDGMIWMPSYGRGNDVARLNPKTAEVTRFLLPFEETAGIHSAIPAPDGTVWFTEARLGRIGHLDPRTKQITEYQDTLPDGAHAGKHTVRMDDSGNVWTSGGRVIARFDVATKKFTHFDVAGTYGNVVGKNGEQWFTVFRDDGPIVRITKNGVVSKFSPPTKGRPQRLQLDSDGVVWFTERSGAKIGRFDPKTETFKEFPLPGPSPSPYALGIDRNQMIWYASHEQDMLNRLDPKTGEVTEYPFPHSEASIRELFLDSQGRMWYASPSNNRVGYFIPPPAK